MRARRFSLYRPQRQRRADGSPSSRPSLWPPDRSQASHADLGLFVGCWCRANRLLSRSECLADVLLGILQEAFGATQGIAAAVQNLSSLLIYRPHPLRCPSAHAARLFPHIALELFSPKPYDAGARDHSENENLTGSHVRS